jgi:ketosteroid isomerase-like protein
VRRFALLAAIVLASGAQAAGTRLTEAAVRAFCAHQEAAWNAGDVNAWAATYTPDAVIVDQAQNSQGGLTVTGSSTLAQARAQAKRFFAKSRVNETSSIDSVTIAADGRSARVYDHEVSHIETPGRPARTLCGQSVATLVLVRGRILASSQTDTAIRCPK